MNTISVQAVVNALMAKVWEFWNKPEHITKWAFASDDWEALAAENDLCVGGKFKTVMAAKDKSSSFDFGAAKRHVKVEFMQLPDGIKVTETFDPESENTEEMQRSGWQAILDNFKTYAESKK